MLKLLLGSPLAISIPTANLPFVISTPAVHKPILGPGDGVMLSTGHLDDVVAFKRIEVLDPGRNSCIILCPDSKLSVVVQPPGKKLVFVIHIERVVISAEDICSALGSHFLNLKRLLVSVSSFKVSSDLSRLGVTPSVDFAASRESQSMLSSTRDLLELHLRPGVKELVSNPCW